MACLSLNAPPGAVIAPALLGQEERNAGLQLVTFQQATSHCGDVARRYLLYVPRSVQSQPAHVAIIALHGLGSSAEHFRIFHTRGTFDQLADQHGFVLVYANAAPGSSSNDKIANSGAWRARPTPGTEIDDLAYLDTVVANLKGQGHLAKDGKVFLVGHSNGGGMILEAARHRPGTYAAIAAFMPFDGLLPASPSPGDDVPPLLLAYSDADPGLPKGYAEGLKRLGSAWASALKADPAPLGDAGQELPDRVQEGSDDQSTLPVIRATRNSRAHQIDRWVTQPAGAPPRLVLRVLHFDRAGHFWPHPQQDAAMWALSRWGFRNQDLDGAEACWAFFAVNVGAQ